MHCSQKAKIRLAYVRIVVLQEFLPRFPEIEALEPERSCNSGLRLWKELNLSSVLFGKAFRFKLECERDM